MGDGTSHDCIHGASSVVQRGGQCVCGKHFRSRCDCQSCTHACVSRANYDDCNRRRHGYRNKRLSFEESRRKGFRESEQNGGQRNFPRTRDICGVFDFRLVFVKVVYIPLLKGRNRNRNGFCISQNMLLFIARFDRVHRVREVFASDGKNHVFYDSAGCGCGDNIVLDYVFIFRSEWELQVRRGLR